MAIPHAKVEIVRLTYGWFVVSAYDMFGAKIKESQSPWFLSTETRRKEWAIEQAKQWAERFYLWLDLKIYD